MAVPKMAKNGSKSVSHGWIMDLFDERILPALSDGKPRIFAQLLGEAGFSRNTLKLHLKRLTAQS
jgi:DNA-binding Lrp family transcriptional regulator